MSSGGQPYLLYRLQGLCVFLLGLPDFCQTATPDVGLHLPLKRLHTHTHRAWLACVSAVGCQTVESLSRCSRSKPFSKVKGHTCSLRDRLPLLGGQFVWFTHQLDKKRQSSCGSNILWSWRCMSRTTCIKSFMTKNYENYFIIKVNGCYACLYFGSVSIALVICHYLTCI